MKHSIIIPAYNEDLYLLKLISLIREKYSIPIIIIDDGSDNKIDIKGFGENIYILRNNENKGKGYSILKGINHSHAINCSHSIVMDGDLQHPPELIEELLESWREGFEIVYTVRTATKNISVDELKIIGKEKLIGSYSKNFSLKGKFPIRNIELYISIESSL